ncbi:MAG: DUF1801 domain-containing protein [Gemmatimonadales bacterium]
MARPAPRTATSVADVLAQVPTPRRAELERVRKIIRKHLPGGYEEVASKGMIVYQVPLARYSDTFNGHPSWYAALAAQKNYLTLHLMGVYGSKALLERLETGFKAAGKKLDMGKACIRFQSADDLALDVIGDIVAAVPVDKWVEIAGAARRR